LHRIDGRNIGFLFQVEAPVEHGLRWKPSLPQRLRDGRDLILAPRWWTTNIRGPRPAAAVLAIGSGVLPRGALGR
jgi:hypothetical protein